MDSFLAAKQVVSRVKPLEAPTLGSKASRFSIIFYAGKQMSPLRHRHIPYAYPKGKKVPKGRGRSEIRLSSLNTSEKCSGWHRQAPHHPSDGLSYPQDSFIAVHRAAQHPRLPGQGGGKSNSKQEADPTFFQHSRAGVDGSGQQHLQASAVDLKSLISHGL